MYDLYASYNQHKLLFEFYKDHQNVKGIDEIKNRIEYITKNKIKQRDEISTLLWVIGESSDEINYQTENIT